MTDTPADNKQTIDLVGRDRETGCGRHVFEGARHFAPLAICPSM
jgi:hypothetical protein